ncbi:MAG: stage II sporulation protein M [Bacillota bacterium]
MNHSPISHYLIQHKHQLIGLFVIFLIGVVLGSYTMVQSFAETLTLSVPNFTVTAWSITEYATVLIDNVWFYLVLYVAGLSFIGLPIIYFTYMVLGVRVGYTIAVCLSTYEYRGVILAMSALVIDHLIFLPLSLLFGIQALHIHKLFLVRVPLIQRCNFRA